MATDIQAIAAAVRSEGLPWTPGETSLTGLSEAEQRRRLGVLVDAAEMQRLIAVAQQAGAQERVGAAVGAPAAVDWRNNGGNYVTPIKNQSNAVPAWGSAPAPSLNPRFGSSWEIPTTPSICPKASSNSAVEGAAAGGGLRPVWITPRAPASPMRPACPTRLVAART